jgi:hypothetical protein
MDRLIEEQGRLIEELREERRGDEAERVNQPQPPNAQSPLLRNPARQPPDILERHTRPVPAAPQQNPIVDTQPVLRIGGQVCKNPAVATERRRDVLANPQLMNEVVAENDLTLGYCRNPFTSDTLAQELPVGFQFAKKLDDYDGKKDPHQHVQNFEIIVTLQSSW